MPDVGLATRTVADTVLAELARRGTRRVWGLPGGGSSLDLIGGMERHGLRFVLARHEGAAAMAAVAEAELTGAPGVVMTTKGPGLASALNGLAAASLERAPVLLISDGFTDVQAGWVTHQVFDQRAASAPFVIAHARGNADGDVAALLDAAARERRPAHLDLTGDAATAT
jgi:acetolactate synthase-1/2/3 large subunit